MNPEPANVVAIDPRTTRRQALWRGLCPRCRSGRIFAGRWRMNETCPVCQLTFEREPGYFVGAMYVSYVVSVPAMSVLTALWYWLLPGRSIYLVVCAALVSLLPLVPVVFRYSRIVWIHFDRYVDPNGDGHGRR